jgi:VWFA-related protein
MSFGSIYFTRDALSGFAARYVRPGDLVGLVRTSGSRYPEVLTALPEELRQSIQRLSFTDMRALADDLGQWCLLPELRARLDSMLVKRLLARLDDVIETLRPLSGRKAIALVSEGIRQATTGPGRFQATRTLQVYLQRRLRDLVDRANRAGVVIYALDPRGLEIPCSTDADVPLDACLSSDSGQDALHYISGETGGFAVVNTSNLRAGLTRILHDQQGYYVIGYQPDSDTFGNGTDPKYHRVKVKVRKKGLKVRSRQGFYAVPTD